jgi:hypothetical protein
MVDRGLIIKKFEGSSAKIRDACVDCGLLFYKVWGFLQKICGLKHGLRVGSYKI